MPGRSSAGRWTSDPMRSVGAAAAVLALGLAGCTPAEEGPSSVVRDSAGVRIVESFRPATGTGSGWRWEPEPLLRLGVLSGDPAEEFDQVVGLLRLPTGGVVVADGGAQAVRFFGPEGDLLAVAGGPGEGPGEFSGLAGLGRGLEGEIWAYDFALRRVTWISPEGEVLGITSLGGEPPVLNAVGVLPDGTFVLKQLWGAAQVAEAAEPGLRRDPVAYVRFDRAGTLLDTLGLFPGREVFLGEEDGRGVMSTPPFARNSVGAVWGGGVVVGDQTKPELAVVDAKGRLVQLVRLPEEDLTLGAEERKAFLEARLAGAPPERRARERRRLEEMAFPSRKPAYGSVLAGADGRLWVSEWAAEPQYPRLWRVIAPGGEWLAEVEMPLGFLPFDAGEDWVLGVEKDELDVERVALYVLRGSGSEREEDG